MSELLYYDNVALQAKYFGGDSRSNCDTSVSLGVNTFKLPITPANMKCSIDFDIAERLGNSGYFYILHRFYNYDDIKQWIIDRQDDLEIISISLGVQQKDWEMIDWLTRINSPIVDYITIDVAHGHSKSVKDLLEYITSKFGDSDEKPYIIAGNVMSRDAVEDLVKWGADAVKVGIGQGRVCSTKLKTGFTHPMFSCVKACSTTIHDSDVEGRIRREVHDEYERELQTMQPSMFGGRYSKNPRINNLLHSALGNPKEIPPEDLHQAMRDDLKERCESSMKNRIPIIADGGMAHNGDIAKAICAGACMTMAGNMFASCIDSPAEAILEDDNPIPIKKRYFGSASEENKGTNKNVEGFLAEIPCNKMIYTEKLEEIKMDLQSAISYAGGTELLDLRAAEWKILR